ncbi:5-formyltetrahydrofolate cyclo-ligase [Lichenihabitans sp. Uapishka_5]|uniref:5-formyltetrahydrofolate cyclo-ligase n=1 Tax=Lichenihabitans sp. Uapishka_5 TaxID=3037302 RepID=UPI0029E7DE08|nr:5-formyltetrahydrofolate cyclo-ligase [Lichenihabitans sp. Uapishka_5]MDX7952880.1 5-formyltetrahydrofolate cyclo-ligase [Lichenihabitans sp. Uapishka_5]
MTDTKPQARWAGRNHDKDALRAEVWSRLERDGLAVGPVWSRIPNWVGADAAAKHLSDLPVWAAARIVKCNPDPPQIPVRLRALYAGKVVYMPVPQFEDGGAPWTRLDPVKLEQAGVSFELAATSQGGLQHGEPCGFEAIEPLDLAVCGSVAVTRSGARTGKGGGFADLELGLFRDLGLIGPDTPIVTTVHSSMVVSDDRIPILPHDSAVHWVVTEAEAIATHTTHRQPAGVVWDAVLPDQFRDIPFLRDLQARILRRQADT